MDDDGLIADEKCYYGDLMQEKELEKTQKIEKIFAMQEEFDEVI
jgi:hypothetical protein